ncbi:MAG: hypothetical protein NTZ63_00510 [Candidatus Omnitrophica bacterium]|nr:hypothetical protein [Candidatus Omnitrophota bacterium]
MKRAFWVNVMFSVFVLILLFALGETSSRVFVYFKYGKSERGMSWRFQYEPYLFHNDIRMNPLDKAYPPKKNKFRVIILGGSTAAQIPNNLFVDSLRPMVNREIEVINLARSGYIVNQERIAFLLYGIKLDPDLLISIDGCNDIVTMTKTLSTGLPYHNKFMELAVNHPFANLLFGILRNSQFVNCLVKIKERQIEIQAQKDNGLAEKCINNYVEGLYSISVIAKGLNIPYIAVLQPYVHLKKNISSTEKFLRNVKNYLYRKQFFVDMYSKIDSTLAKYPFAGNTIYINGNRAFDDTHNDCFVDEVHINDQGEKILVQYILSYFSDNVVAQIGSQNKYSRTNMP